MNLPLSFCCVKPISSKNIMQKANISLHILKYVVQVVLDDHNDEIGHSKIFALSYQKLKSVPNMRSTADFSDLPNMKLSNSYNGQSRLVGHFPNFRKIRKFSLIQLLVLQQP